MRRVPRIRLAGNDVPRDAVIVIVAIQRFCVRDDELVEVFLRFDGCDGVHGFVV